jgi:hypothetical protein
MTRTTLVAAIVTIAAVSIAQAASVSRNSAGTGFANPQQGTKPAPKRKKDQIVIPTNPDKLYCEIGGRHCKR